MSIFILCKRKREKAVIDTMVQGIQDILEEYGEVPEYIVNRLKEIDDKELLRKWHKLAAKVNSIEEFEAEMQPV